MDEHVHVFDVWDKSRGPFCAICNVPKVGWEARPLDRLRQAIEKEGPRPDLHREVMARHRREWPTLWAAIDAVLDGGPTDG